MLTNKSYQEWCIDTLYYILKNKPMYRGVLIDQGYIYSIKAIIDHYSSMYYCTKPFCKNAEKEHINLWWDHLNRKNITTALSHLLISKDAYNKVINCINSNKDPKELKKELHFEHMTPKGYTFNKIIGLSIITPNTILECFKYAKLILITKKESELLDGSGKRYTDNAFTHFQNNLGKGRQNDINEAQNVIGKSLKSNGTGIIRADYLLFNGKEFVDINGTAQTLQQIIDYLNDHNLYI